MANPLFTVRVLALALAVIATGCLMEPGDEEEGEIGDYEAEFAKTGAVRVVQCNPFWGGMYSTPDRGPGPAVNAAGELTYPTAHRFARMLRDKYPGVAAIGMQEITGPGNAEDIRAILAKVTGRTWSVRYYNQHAGPDALPATKEAIFWRSDRFDAIADFGTKEVERIDHNGGRENFSVRFGGLLLRRKGDNRTLGIFTGKLVWAGQTRNGRTFTQEDRAEEAAVLRRWINEKMAPWPRATRVVVLDQNADRPSPAYSDMSKEYSAGGANDPTFGDKQFDFVYWDLNSGAKRAGGFFGEPRVSPNFGSDHRAVIADVYVSGP